MSSQEEDIRMEQEAYQESLVRRTDIQNSLLADIESDIHIVKHKIDDMKEEYRQFEDEADFAERLEKLYMELANYEHRLAMIKKHPYNSPLQTNTSHRNPSWIVSEVNSDPNFTVGYEDDGTMSLSTEYNPFAEALVSGVLGDDEGSMKMTPIDYDSQFDRLNKDL